MLNTVWDSERETQPAPLSLVQDAICRDPACPCATHRALDSRLLTIYVPGWETWRLTDTEMRLTIALMPPNSIVSHSVLLRRVWGPYVNERHLLGVNIARMRAKMRPHGWEIESLVDVGYRVIPCEPSGTAWPPRLIRPVKPKTNACACGRQKKIVSQQCLACSRQARLERSQRRQVCPECQGWKAIDSQRCQACARVRMKRRNAWRFR